MKHVDLVKTPTYKAWHGIKQRVRTGHNGLQVCDRWLNSFDNFVDDMGPKPNKKNWQLGRIDYLKGFYKENCKWEPIGSFKRRMSPKAGEYALPLEETDMAKLVQDACDTINSAYIDDQEEVLLSKLDDIEKRAESGEEEGLNQVDAFRLLKEAAQATKKALKAVASYGR